MIEITDKAMCSGCTACKSICPQSCIKMEEDFEGFLYPKVENEKCIKCGQCIKVCPILKHKVLLQDVELKAVCLRSKSQVVLENSTSGGFFTPLCHYILNNNGVVIGAAFTQKKKIEHIVIQKDNSDKLYKLRGSKYVQSNLNDIFRTIKNYLKENKIVCFSGTPCQVAGLHSFLGKEYKNLITVDVVCHGTPSPKLWDKYINYHENKRKSEVIEVSFRKKTYGYHSGTMELIFSDGNKYQGSARIDFMLKSFFSEISSRPSCYQCKFKSSHHNSEFTIFDSWHAADLVENLKDDDKGYTNVLINNDKAEQIFKLIQSDYIFYSINAEKAINLDGKMVRNSAIPHRMRSEFYKSIAQETLDKHIQKFIPISRLDYIVEFGKGIMYKLGLLNIIKKFIRK